MTDGIKIRAASPEDAPALLRVYAPYVKNTAITYEYDVPSVDEFSKRIETTLKRFPYLVLERDGEIIGYAYAGPLHSRPAYDWSVETSLYLSEDVRGGGLGRLLHDALENVLREQGFLNMNACIAYPEKEDKYLTFDSVKFHEKMGYAIVGTFHRCAFKFDRCYHMVWLEKMLTKTDTAPQPVIPFSQLDKALINKIVLE
ncbi:GNAT family N-acetyltransferase [uncultured Ruminococcus sp.]|uniref:GNAT family N-acetyltransferase n=1 Tax=uncultured Ruminococcus sp. TaxID=165186 RepID=UPI0025D2D6E2|nr:GNAT family N-acetyltransferase [uncultured Ruminococcus sp.]